MLEKEMKEDRSVLYCTQYDACDCDSYNQPFANILDLARTIESMWLQRLQCLLAHGHCPYQIYFFAWCTIDARMISHMKELALCIVWQRSKLFQRLTPSLIESFSQLCISFCSMTD